MDLHGQRLAALLIEYLETVHKGDGQDGAFGLQGAAEAAAVEFSHGVAVFTAGAFREDQIVPSGLDFLGNVLDHGQRLAHIFPVHGEGLGAGDDLLEQGHIGKLLLEHAAQSAGVSGSQSYHIEHTLVVAVEQITVFLGDVLQTGHLYLYIAGMDGQMHEGADVGEFFLLGILVGVFGVVAELGVSAGHLVDVLKYHQCEPVHKGTSWSKKNLLLFYM